MLLAILLPTSCSNDDDIFVDSNTNGEKVSFTMGVSIPGATGAESRAFGKENHNFENLYIAVFEKNEGIYYFRELEKIDKNTIEQVEEGSEIYWTFNVELTVRENKVCRVHLIANYENLEMGFNEEGQLMGRLETTEANQDVYWNYRNLNGITASSVQYLQRVPLVRNYAKVKLDTENIATATNFILDGYALYNVPTKGKVAAYNPLSQNKFANFVADDGTCNTYAYMLNNENYTGYEPNNDGTTFLDKEILDSDWISSNDPTYMYERSHQNTDEPTCMIIKGRYVQTGTPTASTKSTYYKLDFVYDDVTTQSKVYYNLLRNFVYTMNINSISGPGYDSVAEALNKPASNNIGGDAVAEDFTNVSDGLGRIFVSHTDTTMTSGDDIVLRYKYVPSIQNYNVVANERVEVEGILDGTGSVIKGVSKIVHNATDDGWAEVTFKVQSPGAITHLQEVVLNVKDNANLHKTIRYRLQKPLTMKVNCWPKAIAKFAGRSINVAIRLPEYMTKDMFPLDLAIEVEQLTLSPDASKENNEMPVEPDYSIVPNKKGKRSYHFVKTIETYEDYLNLERYEGEKLVSTYWLTTKAANASNVYVYNKYFTLANDDFYNAEEFTLLEFPDGVKKGVGNSVTFQFNMNTITPVTVTLEGLTNANGETTFVYTPASLGRQTLTLKTAQDSGTVTVTLRADKYADTSLSAVQTSEVNVPTLTVKFTYPSRTGAPQANAVKPTLAMSGNASVSYGSISNPTRTRNGNTYDFVIPFRDLLIKDASDDSVLSISYTTGNYTFKGTITVSELKGDNPTVTLSR